MKKIKKIKTRLFRKDLIKKKIGQRTVFQASAGLSNLEDQCAKVERKGIKAKRNGKPQQRNRNRIGMGMDHT